MTSCRVIIGVLGTFLVPAGSVMAEDLAGTPDNQLESVVVTAQRRATTIQDTPAAVSSYDGTLLKQLQINDLADLAAITPGVQFGNVLTNAKITIRGIGNGNSSAGADPGVAVHYEGVYLSQTALATTTFLDLDHVEVLRGPQGTLFGRNATGGAINLIPKQPTGAFEAEMGAAAGFDPSEFRVDGFVSGKLDDSGVWLGRLSVEDTYNEGFTTNTDRAGPSRLDDANNYAVRAQLKWQPSDVFSARLLFDNAKSVTNGPAYFFLGTPDASAPLPAPIQGAYFGSVNERSLAVTHGTSDLSFTGETLITDWQIGAGDLKTTVAVDRTKQYLDIDGDGSPVDFTNTSYTQSATQRFVESIYASDAHSKFVYVIGANFFNEDMSQNVTVPISYFPLPVILTGTLQTNSYAAFAHGDYTIVDPLTLFAGLRYSHDRKHLDEGNNYVGTLTQEHSWSRVTYQAGARYKPSAQQTVYLQYATGYKSGGYQSGNLQPAFNPETSGSIEAGIKGTYLQDRVATNLAAFHMTYNNLQVNQVIGVSARVTNAARAKVDGLEAEIEARVTQDLRLSLAAALLDARFDQFMTADSARPSLGTLNLAGNRLPNAPRLTLSPSFRYRVPLRLPGDLNLDGSYDWKSRVYFSEFNLPVSSQRAAGTFNLNVNYSDAGGHWQAGLYARNITDEKIIGNVLVVSALLGSQALGELNPGRELGFTFRYSY
ncbi:MAG: TonB-dependent receptor [Gammaproteobacteria bacterium]|jgi:iron complex outermembrane receptor protein|nr:TonB-dependent receptor [Gammaproteobacteria bacterium]